MNRGPDPLGARLVKPAVRRSEVDGEREHDRLTEHVVALLHVEHDRELSHDEPRGADGDRPRDGDDPASLYASTITFGSSAGDVSAWRASTFPAIPTQEAIDHPVVDEGDGHERRCAGAEGLHEHVADDLSCASVCLIRSLHLEKEPAQATRTRLARARSSDQIGFTFSARGPLDPGLR